MIDNLKRIAEDQGGKAGPLYLRNLLKEEIQNYVLNFVYNNKVYKELIFTGGTCLRKVYGLPRLSEDLDFDFREELDLEDFAGQAQNYFRSDWQYKEAAVKISSNGKTVFLKFPIMEQLGLGREGEVLFVRCDFSREKVSEAELEINSVSSGNLTFFVRNYDLPTLFANKIRAFLTRDYFRGRQQAIAFKARDIFDLVWFLERVRRSEGEFQPNWRRLIGELEKSREGIISEITDKIQLIDEDQVRRELEPFLESSRGAEAFSRSFKEVIVRGFKAFSGEG